ncbi:MAG: MBL fold metallo-hydrolase [Ruminococcus sp.]|nr:MBL fold metallo-hydrolase [Ruminococcus sp.]
MLKFLGRGSAFADEHNSAFFVHDNDLILIDCPATTFQKVKKMKGLSQFENIFILVTHTHGDHSGGIGTMLQYAWFALNKKVTVVAPSEQVENDLNILLRNIEGCEKKWFSITTAGELNKKWLVSSVPTRHTETLDGRCFGYHLKINGKNVVYTGDTEVLAPFLLLLKNGDYLYTEASYYKSGVHLHINDILPELVNLAKNGINVYLMHLDDEEEIEKIIENTDIKLAPLFQEK